MNKDEFEGFLTAEIPFFEQNYLVLQGLSTDSGVVARHLVGGAGTAQPAREHGLVVPADVIFAADSA
ncbi:hypothetical protein ACIHAX_35605 [Nocardia sp. NPDC051929]|uniref:hypothetical protein n=1 Tax=Nocardia sp. NPDC051929 TaxID=3364327 RepID=UPI0037C8C0CA